MNSAKTATKARKKNNIHGSKLFIIAGSFYDFVTHGETSDSVEISHFEQKP